MLIISKRVAAQEKHDVELVLPFDQRQRSRLRTELEDGEEVGLFLERGQLLRDGDYLLADDGRVVVIRARAERILHVSCASDRDLVRVAYHLGNRHVALQVGDGWVRIADDHVLREMVEGLGAQVKCVEAPFEPEAGAYRGHHHGSEAGRSGSEAGRSGSEATGNGRGIIHEFGQARGKARFA
jgi:urease accessory protein